jgi:predicted nucleic acid-binding protein
MPEELVISDASPLIALVGIGRVDLLRQMYQRVLITDVVRGEIHAALPEWIEVSTDYGAQEYQLLCLELDAGAASAIALALKQTGSRIILDERKGRIVAKRLNLKVTGTVGLIVKAKEAGFIASGKAVLTQLEAHGFWLSEKLKRQILARMGESDNE